MAIAGAITPPAQAQSADMTMVTFASQCTYSRLAPGLLTETSTLVVDDATNVWIQINASTDDLTTSVEGPAGQILDETTMGTYGGVFGMIEGQDEPDSTNMAPTNDPGYHYMYFFPSLGAGTYTVHYQADPGITDDVAIITQLMLDSPVRATLRASAHTVIQGQPVVLMAPITEGTGAVLGATVDAAVFTPLDTEAPVSLLDDGSQVDAIADDGLYCGYFLTPEVGEYVVVANITGVTSGGTPFARTATTTVRVVPPHATFTSTTFTDQGVDTNGNSLYEHVAVTAEVEVVTAGTYILLMRLETAGGTVLAARAEADLAAGTQSIDVNFPAEAFLDANEDGPYTIVYAELLYLDIDAGHEPADMLEGGTQLTQAYLLTDFERPGIRLLGAFSDYGIDTLGDSTFDGLRVVMGIEVLISGSYDWTANLVDSCSGHINAQYGVATLTAGSPQDLELTFDGAAIGAHGVDGPYTVTDLVIIGQGAAIVKGDITDTQAYTAAEFDDYTGLPDCNGNGLPDSCDFYQLQLPDCNLNGIPDECDIAAGTSQDCDTSGVPDECETDCNENGYHDDCDVAAGTSEDCDDDGVPDECQLTLIDAAFFQLGSRFTGYHSDADCDACSSGTTLTRAENFKLDQQYTITSVKVRGWYTPDNDASNVDDFTLILHENDGGMPGTIIYEETDIDSIRTDTGRYEEPFTEWEIELPLLRPLALAPGVYFAEVYNNTAGSPNTFIWETTNDSIPADLVGSALSGAIPATHWSFSDAELALELVAYGGDCNSNGIPDACDLADATSHDLNGNSVPDECEPDCNSNGNPDDYDVDMGISLDCNDNIVPDECEADCNGNSVPDDCDIAAGTSPDCNDNGVPDECDVSAGTSPDVNGNGVPDECDADCNDNGVPDDLDVSGGTSLDCNGNIIPDECEPDCNGNGVADECDITAGTSTDCDGNGVPDECDPDCNGNGVADPCDITSGFSEDCNGNNIPDDCDLASGLSQDCNSNGIPDVCEDDCNNNGIADECDLADGTSQDCNSNDIPDECDTAGGASEDLNGDQIPDECQVLGACCDVSDGACHDFTADQCLTAGGLYMGDGSTCATTTCPFRQYANVIELSSFTYMQPPAGGGIADDMTFEGGGAYELASYDVGVIGGGTGDFDVTASLYTACPGTGGTLIAGTTTTFTDVPDDGQPHVLTAGFAPVVLPDEVWMVLTFSIPGPAWIVAEEAEAGSTEDVFAIDDDPWLCYYSFGGVPHSGFYATIRCTVGIDCNGNNLSDVADILAGTSLDCNDNLVPDDCDLLAGTSADCNTNAVPDECDIAAGTEPDCNANGVPDSCDIASGTSADSNGNGIPDDCDFPDCNANGVPDQCDLECGVAGCELYPCETSEDCNANGVPDECDIADGTSVDCDSNGVPDSCDIAAGTAADCNTNGVPDVCDIAVGTSGDCNANGVPDECDFASVDCNTNGVIDGCDLFTGTSLDVNSNGIPDECDTDCNGNGVPDDWDLSVGTSLDCNTNLVPDECDLVTGTSEDCNTNAVPDECDIAAGTEPDCNANGVPDPCDIASGTSADFNGNGIPDDCEFEDCNANGIPDVCDLDCGVAGCDVYACGTSVDCNGNDVPDVCDIADGTDPDCNGNGVPDSCDIAGGSEEDCNTNGIPDACDIAAGTAADCNANGIPDTCDIADGTAGDCNTNGVPDNCDISGGTSGDCNTNGVPDECEFAPLDCNSNGVLDACDILTGTSTDVNGNDVPDECEPDCNSNGVPDDWDITTGGSNDCQPNGVPDECEPDCNVNGVADECDIATGVSDDCQPNGIPDECEALVEQVYYIQVGDLFGQEEDCGSGWFTYYGSIGFRWQDAGNGMTPVAVDVEWFNGPDGYSAGTTLHARLNGVPDAAFQTVRYYNRCWASPQLMHVSMDPANYIVGGLNEFSVYVTTFYGFDNAVLPGGIDAYARVTVTTGYVPDCNVNGVLDDCDVMHGTSADCNSNHTPDECEPDCNGNGVADECDITAGTSDDCNVNGIPDDCEPDCNGNGIADECDISAGTSLDCNANGVPDECDLGSGTSSDCNSNSIPDDCDYDEVDCNGNGIIDGCDIFTGFSNDCNSTGVPDECEDDCNENGLADECDIASGFSNDCNSTGVPDECEDDCNENRLADECDIASGFSNDCNGTGVPDECENDCNENRLADECDIASGTSEDCNGNGIPDECDLSGGTILYALERSYGSGGEGVAGEMPSGVGLYIMDPETGDTNLIGILDQDVYLAYGLALHPGTSELYAVVSPEPPSVPPDEQTRGGSWRALVKVHRATAAVTIVGWLEEPISDIVFGYHGVLYGVVGNGGGNDGAIVSIDTTDASITYLGINRGNGGGQSIAFDRSTGRLYHMYGQVLEYINPITGEVTPGPMYEYEIYQSLVVDPSADRLLGTSWGTLAEVDLGTGEESFIATVEQFIVGLAFTVNSADCNENGVPDECDLIDGTSIDCDANGIPDECEPDCNENGVNDACDVINGTSLDCNTNFIPDECEPDCNGNGIPDDCDFGDFDCNGNGVVDGCDILTGTSQDCDNDGRPDECGYDCNANGYADICDVTSGTSLDCNENLVPDECEFFEGGVVFALQRSGFGEEPSAIAGEMPMLPPSLFVVNPTDGGLFAVATLPADIETTHGLAIRPGTIEFFGVIQRGCVGEDCPERMLVSADPFTGELYDIGEPEQPLADIEFRRNGILYGVVGNRGFSPGEIVTVNTSNGSLTSTGINRGSGSGQSIAFDPDTGLMYYIAGGRLEMIDVDTGAVTLISEDLPVITAVVYDAATDMLLAYEWGPYYIIDPVTGDYEEVSYHYDAIMSGMAATDGEYDCNENLVPDVCDLEGTSGDCNTNGIPDECDIADGTSLDENGNGIPDECQPFEDCNSNGIDDLVDIADGTSADCNANSVPDECEAGDDCNANGVLDECDIAAGTSQDCNSNAVPDECESGEDCNANGVLDECDVSAGTSVDCNGNGIPDECETDCNANGVPDDCDIAAGTSQDCNSNAVPDECESGEDCNANGVLDECDVSAGTSVDCNGNGIPDECETDCNANGVPDDCDITAGTSQDCNSNAVPDECESGEDCNANGVLDECDISAGTSLDCNGNGIPDECETDCNANGVPDDCDITAGTSQDCNSNAVPDECDTGPDCNLNGILDECDISAGISQDCNSNAIPDECETDCNANGVPDDCDLTAGTSQDCNSNAVPDECDAGEDCNLNGILDECDIATGTSFDGNGDGVPDECQSFADCNRNDIPDAQDIGSGTSQDCNGNEIPDECERDCNGNGVPDDCDVASGFSEDENGNGRPDECEVIAVPTSRAVAQVTLMILLIVGLTVWTNRRRETT